MCVCVCVSVCVCVCVYVCISNRQKHILVVSLQSTSGGLPHKTLIKILFSLKKWSSLQKIVNIFKIFVSVIDIKRPKSIA